MIGQVIKLNRNSYRNGKGYEGRKGYGKKAAHRSARASGKAICRFLVD